MANATSSNQITNVQSHSFEIHVSPTNPNSGYIFFQDDISIPNVHVSVDCCEGYFSIILESIEDLLPWSMVTVEVFQAGKVIAITTQYVISRIELSMHANMASEYDLSKPSVITVDFAPRKVTPNFGTF